MRRHQMLSLPSPIVNKPPVKKTRVNATLQSRLLGPDRCRADTSRNARPYNLLYTFALNTRAARRTGD